MAHKFIASHYGVKIWCWEKSFRVDGSPDFFYTGEAMTHVTAESYCKKLSNIILTFHNVSTKIHTEIEMLKEMFGILLMRRNS